MSEEYSVRGVFCTKCGALSKPVYQCRNCDNDPRTQLATAHARIEELEQQLQQAKLCLECERAQNGIIMVDCAVSSDGTCKYTRAKKERNK